MKRRYLAVAMLALSTLCALASAPEAFEKKGKYGIRDSESGKVILKPKYSHIGNFEDGIAIVTDNERKGIINSEGKELVKCKMNSIDKLSAEYVLLIDKDERYKIFSISKSKQIQLVNVTKGECNGTTLIQARAAGISMGMAMYDLGDIYLMINADKHLVLGEKALDKAFSAPQETMMSAYSRNLRENGCIALTTFVIFNSPTNQGNIDFFIYRNGREDGRYQLYAILGGEVVRMDAEFDSKECRFFDDNAVFDLYEDKLYLKTAKENIYYTNSDSLLYYRKNDRKSEGYQRIEIDEREGIYAQRDGYWRKIEPHRPNDRIILKSPIATRDIPFINLLDYTNDLVIIKNDEGKMGVASDGGEFLVECAYDSIKTVGNKLSLSLSGKAKIYDYTTKQFTGQEFDRVIESAGDYLLVEINGAQYIVASDGKKSVAFDEFRGRCGDGYYRVARNGKMGLLYGTDLFIPFKYKDIIDYKFAPIFVVKTFAGQLGAYNLKGKLVVTPGNYHSFGTCVNDHLIVRRGDMVGALNINTGKLVMAPCTCSAVCANNNSVVIGKELGLGKIKLIAYSDTGKILGTKTTSALKVGTTAGAMDFTWWLESVCPDFSFYEYGL